MAGNKNETIKISNIKDLLSMLAMFLLAVENFTDCWFGGRNISNLPLFVNFMVFAANAYEDNDKWIMIMSIIGCLIVSAIGLINSKINELDMCFISTEFFILGIETAIIFAFYCLKLAKK